jgi:hypothetical protein
MKGPLIYTYTNPISEIYFCPSGEESWAIKITNEGVKFNREHYPNSKPEDFAQFFIDILEMNYDIKFIKK